jgi:hypothetical protein
LRRLGLVTVRHTDTDPFVAVDRAAVRLRHAIARKIAAPDGKSCTDRLAEARWENEGGRIRSSNEPANQFPKLQTRQRHQHAQPQHLQHHATRGTTRPGTPARHPDNRVSRFRSDPAELAHA